MAVDFPSNPTINDTYTAGTRTWLWDGVAWRIVTASVGPTGPTGPAGYVGSDGAPGATGPAGADGRFYTGSTPPMTPAPEEGDAWFNSDTSRLYVYYDSYWVEASAPVAGPTGPAGVDGATGPTGPQGNFLVSDTIPLTAVPGDAWFDSSTSRTYVYMNDAWVEVIGAAGPTGPTGPSGDPVKTIRSVSTNTTLLLNDSGNIVSFTGSSLQTLTVADVLEPGASVKIVQLGSGQVKLSADSGVTIVSSNSLFGTVGQYSELEILCTATGEYLVLGETASVALATGGVITTDGAYTYHTFTSNGSFVSTESLSIDYLIVAGGGAGGVGSSSAQGSSVPGAGGGAGGYISGNTSLQIGSYPIVIGAGGASITNGANITGPSGSNSTFNSLTAIGGGGGATRISPGMTNGGNGGSGGGAGYTGDSGGSSAGSGTANQGNSGGSGETGAPYCAGGGGANAAGQSSSAGGAGGAGKQWLNNSYYAGGGGRGPGDVSSAGSGGIGGGGAGVNASSSQSGTANTGGGGGGGRAAVSGAASSGSGGSGVVVIRYLT